jgi:hypothetical protein
VTSGALRNLKRLELPTFQLLELLSRPPFMHSVEHVLVPDRGSLTQLEALHAWPLPSLKTLTTPLERSGSAQWLAALHSSSLITRIEHYEVVPAHGREAHSLVAEVFARWPELPTARSLTVATQASFREPAPYVRLERIGQSFRLTFHVAFEREGTLLISTLPVPLSEVHVVRTGAWVLRDDTAVKAAALKRSVPLHIHTS